VPACKGEAAPKNCVMFGVPAASAGAFFLGMVFCVAQTREVKIFSRGGFSLFF
jgi:hypothetical protein